MDDLLVVIQESRSRFIWNMQILWNELIRLVGRFILNGLTSSPWFISQGLPRTIHHLTVSTFLYTDTNYIPHLQLRKWPANVRRPLLTELSMPSLPTERLPCPERFLRPRHFRVIFLLHRDGRLLSEICSRRKFLPSPWSRRASEGRVKGRGRIPAARTGRGRQTMTRAWGAALTPLARTRRESKISLVN